MSRLAMVSILGASLSLLCACVEEEKVVGDIRAIKTVTVSAPATAQLRKFSGTVSAVDSAQLSFEVGGKVEKVHVEIGDAVTEGQVLASLDREPYELDLSAAEAEVAKAKASIVASKAEFERQDRVYRQGAGAKSKLDRAQYSYEAAKSALDYRIAQVGLAQRSVRKTDLQAPYDGSIAKRMVEPGEEVGVGEAVFELNGEGALEVVVAVPETTISRMRMGSKASITFPTIPGQVVAGEITDIGSAAVKSNAFPVKIALLNPPKEVSPGMTAEASLQLKVLSENATQETGYLIPVQALLAGKEPREGFVFVYDSKTSTTKKTAVKTKGVQHNMAIIGEGLSEGDIVAVAGASFLADGMKVKLFK